MATVCNSMRKSIIRDKAIQLFAKLGTLYVHTTKSFMLIMLKQIAVTKNTPKLHFVKTHVQESYIPLVARNFTTIVES